MRPQPHDTARCARRGASPPPRIAPEHEPDPNRRESSPSSRRGRPGSPELSAASPAKLADVMSTMRSCRLSGMRTSSATDGRLASVSGVVVVAGSLGTFPISETNGCGNLAHGERPLSARRGSFSYGRSRSYRSLVSLMGSVPYLTSIAISERRSPLGFQPSPVFLSTRNRSEPFLGLLRMFGALVEDPAS